MSQRQQQATSDALRASSLQELAAQYRQDSVWGPALCQLFTVGLTVQILLVLWMRGWKRQRR